VSEIKIGRASSGKKKVCPRCLEEIKVDSISQLSGWLLPQEYFCGSCGYQGTIALEEDN